MVAKGLADRETVDRIAAAWRAWGERPDAFYAVPHGAAVGWTASPRNRVTGEPDHTGRLISRGASGDST